MADRGGKDASSYRRIIVFIVVGLATLLPGLLQWWIHDFYWNDVGYGGMISAEEFSDPGWEILTRILHGVTAFTLMEWTVGCLALGTAALSFAYFNVRDERAAPVVSIAAFWTGLVSIFLILTVHGFGTDLSYPEFFVHLSWTLIQTFTALVLLIGALVMLYYRERPSIKAGHLMIVMAIFALLAYLTVMATANVDEISELIRPDHVVHRPLDLVPLGLFLLGLLVVFPRLDALCGSVFSFALWLSAIPLLGSQVYIAFFSPGLFDPGFMAAQISRLMAFGLIFGGVTWDYARASRSENQLKESLLASSRRIDLLLNNASDAVVIFNEEGEIVRHNPAADAFFWGGEPPEGRSTVEDLFSGQPAGTTAKKEFFEHLEEYRNGGTSDEFWEPRRMEMQRGDHLRKKTIEYVLTGAREASGRKIFAFMGRDISERESLQLRTVQLDRLVAVGTLAAGIAHEINNPLTYLSANLDYALDCVRRMESDASARPKNRECAREIHEALRSAEEGAHRVMRIAGDLKIFSHLSSDKARTTPVLPPLEVAIRMTRGELKKHARLELNVRETALVEADETRLSQVFVNLIINASQAMERDSDREHLLTIEVYREEDDQVISFADTGPGMDERLISQVFIPFFTTKPPGKGSGLGLSLARSIIEDFQGTLTVESRPGSGSIFYVRLPAL